MIEIAIADDFAAAGIDVTLACIQARVAVEKGGTPLGQALRLEAELRVESLDDGPVSEVPAIAAARRAFKALGKDPSRYRVSSEALMRRLAQGKALYRINTVVDTNNLVSLHTGLSAGTYRVEALQPPLVLRKGGAGETYEPIGRGRDLRADRARALQPGEPAAPGRRARAVRQPNERQRAQHDHA